MKRIIPAVIFIFIVLSCWEIIVYSFNIPEYLLPAPTKILFRTLTSFDELLPHLGITLLEAFLGFFVGATLGILLAIIFVHSKTLEMGIFPYAIALKSVPVVAVAPLLIVWFGNGIMPKVIVAAIISFFPIVVNTVRGMRSIDPEALDLFHSIDANKRQIFFKLRVPLSLSYMFAALKMSSTLAVIGAIVGEFAGSDKGLGFFIMISSHRLETVDMFVGIMISSLLGIAVFYLIGFVERFAVPWQKYITEKTT